MKPMNFPARRARRREEAKERAAARGKRSKEQQLELLRDRPGACERERRRLGRKAA